MPSICQEDGQGREEVEAHHQELPHLHQAHRKNKAKSNTYVIKKKANGKVVAHKVGKMEERGWNQPIWVPKEVITNMKGPQMVWVPKST
jgi:hypothetical protein